MLDQRSSTCYIVNVGCIAINDTCARAFSAKMLLLLDVFISLNRYINICFNENFLLGCLTGNTAPTTKSAYVNN